MACRSNDAAEPAPDGAEATADLPFARAPVDERTFNWDEFVAEQVERQLDPPAYTGAIRLDFTPFSAALDALSPDDIAALDAQVDKATVLDLTEQMASGALSAEALTLRALHHMRQREGALHSILELNPDALTAARARDAERTAGSTRGVLHGVPLVLKGNIATGDAMHTTAGAKAMESAHSDRDAFIVTRLRDAGAIILGKANLSEWANFMTYPSANGFSVLGGQTRNPHGPFDVGGSSSGSAVAVAAGYVPISVGTETAGSLVYPASQNGVVTLKPSLGAVSRDRIIPISSAMDTAGPMGRTVTDVAVLMNVLAAVDARDPLASGAAALANTNFAAALDANALDANALDGLRVGVVRAGLTERTGDAEIVERALTVLHSAGAETVDVVLPEAVKSINYVPVLHHDMLHDLNAYLDAVAPQASVRSLAEIVAFNRADLPNRAPYGQTLLEASLAQPLSRAEYEALVENNRRVGRTALRAVLREQRVDVLLSLSNQLTQVYAPAGFPALTVPAGVRPSGEPLGVTFVGDFLDDARLIAVGYAFEQAQMRAVDNMQ